MASWQVDKKELRQTLRQMKKLARGAAGDASWIFTPKSLRIEWSGMGLEIPVEGHEHLIVRVDGGTMRGVTRDRLDRADTMLLEVKNERLHIGTVSIRCWLRDKPVTQILPMNATRMDLLLLPYRHSQEEIDDADLTERVNDVEDRKLASLEAAARTLAWLQISPTHLESWVEAHLQALAAGKKTFDVTPRTLLHDEDGQIDLLGSK